MPRKVSGKAEQQRLRQQRYRQRLKAKAEPEVQELDTALAVAIAAFVNEMEVAQAEARVADDSNEQAAKRAAGLQNFKRVMDKIVLTAVEHLRSREYNGKAAGLLMRRRLRWLQETLKDPNADWLTKRGFQV